MSCLVQPGERRLSLAHGQVVRVYMQPLMSISINKTSPSFNANVFIRFDHAVAAKSLSNCPSRCQLMVTSVRKTNTFILLSYQPRPSLGSVNQALLVFLRDNGSRGSLLS